MNVFGKNIRVSAETVVIFSMTILGAALRLWQVGRLGLNHFDEGVYALSGLWAIRKHGLMDWDPSLVPYAPPGLALLIGLCYGVLGVSDFAAIVPALGLGILTIPLAGLLGRRWLGRGAGAAVAAFAACCGPHIAFSRMAMTDVPFLFVWLLALAAGARFLERPGFKTAVVLGAAVGAAQLFKYNGILAGVVVAFALACDAAGSIVSRRGRTWIKALAWGLVAACVAGLVYWPWFAYVDRHGGYRELLNHQRGYFKGVGFWLADWNLQMEQGTRLAGGLGASFSLNAIAAAIAWPAMGLALHGTRFHQAKSRWSGAQFRVGLGLAVIAASALPGYAYWIGLASAPCLLAQRDPKLRVLGSAWALGSLVTPLYHPYARLWLPVTACGWFMTALVFRRAQTSEGLQETNGEKVRSGFAARIGFSKPEALGLGVCLVIGVAAAAYHRVRVEPLSELLAASDSLGESSRTIAATLGQERAFAFVSPSARYYLLSSGAMIIPVGSQEDLERRTSGSSLAVADLTLLSPTRRGGADSALPVTLAGWRTSGMFAAEYRLNLPARLDLELGESGELWKSPLFEPALCIWRANSFERPTPR